MHLSRAACILTALLLGTATARAEEPLSTSLWEAGLIAGGIYGPDYPAARTSRLNGLVLPYAIYRGRLFRSDQDGVRGRLTLGERFELTMGFGAAFPVRSKDNADREGMADLGYLAEAGPAINFRVFKTPDSSLILKAQTRAVFALTGDDTGYQGLILQPEIGYRKTRLWNRDMQLFATVWARFAQDGLNQRFYEVTPADVTPRRPAYQAHDGYLQSALNLALRVPISSRLSVFTTAQFALSEGAANENSPLFRRSRDFSVGTILQYSLFRSKQQVIDPN